MRLEISAMKYIAENRRRRSIRLRGYDYAQAGAYFVTIVTMGRACLFGAIVDGEMRPNHYGRIVQTAWNDLSEHYPGVECDAFVVMPNHVHGIIVLADDGHIGANDVGAGLKPARTGSPASVPRAGLKPAPTLPEIVRAFKTFSARRVNESRVTRGAPMWQRNYYEHIVHGETNCAASANTSPTIRCNGGGIGKIQIPSR